jgi:DNA adenine methylase
VLEVNKKHKRGKMKPVIKWTGGKSREIKEIKSVLPKEYNTYIEPFFGGGAVFFELKPKKAIINDLSKDLITLYTYLKNNNLKLKKELYLYVENWEKIKKFVELMQNELFSLYKNFRHGYLEKELLKKEIEKILNKKVDSFNGLFKDNFCIKREELFREILKNIFSKLVRIKNIEIHEKKKFSDNDMLNHIETAFRSGFYSHFRNILNNSIVGPLPLNNEKKIATYYFIREFCYGSMFRFNEGGEFNIPYGGITYNKKDFRKKVDNLFSKEIEEILENTIIYNMDFKELLKKIKINKDDFVFLDPPYDSEFSEYDQHSFDKLDQERLASLLVTLKAKFILIIKNTPFILGLYKEVQRKNSKINIKSFDKTYISNMRGRNSRKVKHLIIKNF